MQILEKSVVRMHEDKTSEKLVCGSESLSFSSRWSAWFQNALSKWFLKNLIHAVTFPLYQSSCLVRYKIEVSIVMPFREEPVHVSS